MARQVLAERPDLPDARRRYSLTTHLERNDRSKHDATHTAEQYAFYEETIA